MRRILFVVGVLALLMPAAGDAVGPGGIDRAFGDGGRVVTGLQVGASPQPGLTPARPLAVLADDRLAAGGMVLDGAGAEAFAIEVRTADGAVDPTWGTGGRFALQLGAGAGTEPARSAVDVLLAMPDGGVVAAGTASTADAARREAVVVRLDARGAVRWISRAALAGGLGVGAIAADGAGGVLVAGAAFAGPGSSSPAMAVLRLREVDGSADLGFGRGLPVVDVRPRQCVVSGVSRANGVVAVGGRVVLGGNDSRCDDNGGGHGGPPLGLLSTFAPDGARDSADSSPLGGGGLPIGTVRALAPSGSGAVLAGRVSGGPGVVRYDAAGRFDARFGVRRLGPDGSAGEAQAVAAEPDGDLVVVVEDPTKSHLVRLAAGGRRDRRFVGGRVRASTPGAVDLQADGSVVVAGAVGRPDLRTRPLVLERFTGGDAVGRVRVRDARRGRGGRVAVRLSCRGPYDCEGVAQLRSRTGHPVARRRYTLERGAGTRIVLRAAGRRRAVRISVTNPPQAPVRRRVRG